MKVVFENEFFSPATTTSIRILLLQMNPSTQTLRWAALAALTIATTSAQAAVFNFITNGDFETGNFDGWTPVGEQLYNGVHGFTVFAGSYSSRFGTVESNAGISQTITGTIPGQSYTVSFMLKNDPGGPANFEALWNGVAQLTLV